MSELDVQLHPTGVAVTLPDEVMDENLPGQINLSDDEADSLESMLREARLNRHGMQPMSVQVINLQRGDVFPDLGQTVKSARYADSTNLEVLVIFETHHNYSARKMYLSAAAEVTITRRIA